MSPSSKNDPTSARQRSQIRGSVQVEFLLLLLLLPLGGILYLFAERRRLRDRRRMAGGANASPATQSRLRHFVRLLIAAGFLILALSRPAWREVPMDSTQEGRDIVFLLDVSRSMLAEDLAPNRLKAAKTAIRDCVDTLEGDRVGLVVFAGSASILCPLTNDYHFFYDKLNEAHPDFVSPGDTRVGGTRIGDALHKICDKLLSIERLGYQDVVLLSDGGDQDSRPDRAAERLNNLQVRFLLVGLGDSIQGARIPARADDETQQGPFVRYEGDVVWSKLEDDGLKALAEACTHGVFLRAGTRVLPLGEIYQKLVSHFDQKGSGRIERISRKQETFPIFLGLSLWFLVGPLPRFQKWRKPRHRKEDAPVRAQQSATTAAMLLALALFLTSDLHAESPRSFYREGVTQFQAGNYTVAHDSFLRAANALSTAEQRSAALFNAALCCHRRAEVDEELDPASSEVYYRQAADTLRSCLAYRPNWTEAQWNLELALAALFRITTEQDATDDQQQESESEPQEGESEEGEGEDMEMDEEDWEESEAEGASESSAQQMGEDALDLDSQDLPPPMMEPEDIFRQEQENGELREKNSSSGYKAVERDW